MNCNLLLFSRLRSAVADATHSSFHFSPALKGWAKIRPPLRGLTNYRSESQKVCGIRRAYGAPMELLAGDYADALLD
jgi:hypothetical protein